LWFGSQLQDVSFETAVDTLRLSERNMVKKPTTPRRSVAKKSILPRSTVEFWAVELSGDSSDLESWEESLREPFDPWVEFQHPPDGGPRILRSKEFDNLTSYQEVNTRAQIMVDRLNGALRAATQTRKVSIGYIWRQLRDDASVGGAGKSEASSRSSAQRWLSYASSHDVAAEMLSHFGNAPNWFDLYKTYEGIRDLAGGMSGLKSKSWKPPSADIDRFTHTANFHRHALPHGAKKKPSKNPMSLQDAASMISAMMRSILDELAR
jgi:hypothetical protein